MHIPGAVALSDPFRQPPLGEGPEAPANPNLEGPLGGTPKSAAGTAVAPDFLAGVGEMGALMRAKNWADTPLGPAEAWPQSLRTVVRILLTSRYQMWMGWGDKLTFFYNDAYRPTLGVKHAWALGAS